MGPLLFSFYMLLLAGIVQSFSDISYNFYADGIQLRVSFKPHQLDRFSNLVQCLTQVSTGLSSSYLVLNTNKTETMITAPYELHSKTSQVLASFCPSAKIQLLKKDSELLSGVFWLSCTSFLIYCIFKLLGFNANKRRCQIVFTETDTALYLAAINRLIKY